MSVIQTKNLNIGYEHKKGKQVIAKDISVVLESGKLISLLGSNGIGKSTLLKTLSGILPPLSGSVLIDNQLLEAYSSSTLSQKLSLVLTEKLPESSLTVYELIALGRQPYTNWLDKLAPQDISQIENAMVLTDIAHLRNKKYYELSDGQFQKVLISRAIAQDTPIIILDEPSTHLDLYHKVKLFKLLKTLAENMHKCIVFSTHDLDLALQLSDQIILMKSDGLYFDTPNQLIEQGVFDHFFDDETIIFDRNNKQFRIR